MNEEETIVSAFRKISNAPEVYKLASHQITSLPFILSSNEFVTLQKLSNALNFILPIFVENWHKETQLGEALRDIVKLPPRINNILLAHAKEHNEALVAACQKLGSIRPDFIVEKQPNGEHSFQICEINARFALNGYLLSYFLNEVARVSSCSPSTKMNKLKATSIPHVHSFLDDFYSRVGLFDPEIDTIWFIREVEPLEQDLSILKENHPDKFHSVSPRRLGIENDNLVNLDTKQIIRSCILEIHQHELFNLDENILRKLLELSDKGKCLNDLRTVLLIHDKRLLSILSGYYAQILDDLLPGSDKKCVKYKEALKQGVIRSIPIQTVFSQRSNMKNWMFLSGGHENSILCKPSFNGKGKGIRISHEFATFDNFCEYVRENHFYDDSKGQYDYQEYFKTGILQPFIKVATKWVPQVLGEVGNTRIEDVELSIVGTFLNLDGIYYGPGIFRLNNEPIIALTRGGKVMVPALSLPEIPSSARFALSKRIFLQHPDTPEQHKERNALKKELRRQYAMFGGLLITIDDSDGFTSNSAALNEKELEYLVSSLIGGSAREHVGNRESTVWDIQVTESIEKTAIARSHTNKEFTMHTDASWEDPPPQAIALNVKKADRLGGGYFIAVPCEEILNKLPKQARKEVYKAVASIPIPPEFQSAQEPMVTRDLPIMMAKNRIRYREDLLDVPIMNEFAKEASKYLKDRSYYRLIPEKYVIITDNHRFLHARTKILDKRRHLQRIRFNLPHLSPELDLMMINKYNTLDIQEIPISTKINELSDEKEKEIRPIFWSPSGQSLVNASVAERFDKLVPSNIYDNIDLRKMLGREIRTHNVIHEDITCLNLFAFGYIYRAGQIVSELFHYCGATVFPLGTFNVTDEEIAILLNNGKFKINALAGLSSRLASLANKALKGEISLKQIKVIMFASEPLTHFQREVFRSVCAKDVEFVGIYGSAECGVIAFQSSKTIKNAGLSEKDDDVYQFLHDAVHFEILDENDQPTTGPGRIVITNFYRDPPTVRFDTGDFGRWVENQENVGRNLYFRMLGRQRKSLSHPVGNGWLCIQDVENEVLLPLALNDIPFQIELSSQSNLNHMATLVIYEDDRLKGSDQLNRLEQLFAERVLYWLEVDGAVRLVKMEELVRSARSSKLLRFVDLRK